MALTVAQQVANIVTIANLMEVTKMTLEKVGYEHHAPLEPSELNEVLSTVLNEKVRSEK